MEYTIGAAILGIGILIGFAIATKKNDDRLDDIDHDLAILYNNDQNLADGINDVSAQIVATSERLATWVTDASDKKNV